MRSWKHVGLLGLCLTSFTSVWGQFTPAPAPSNSHKSTWTFLSQRIQAVQSSETPVLSGTVATTPAMPLVQTKAAENTSNPLAGSAAPASLSTKLSQGAKVWNLPTSVPEVAAPKQLPLAQDLTGQVADRLRADELAARKRQADIRYLGGIDSRYWPEVQEVLLLSLRCDPNEAVRHEAAVALGRGFNCSKTTLRALSICVNASQEDGYPAEASPRVRSAARKALAHYAHHFERFVSKNIPLSQIAPQAQGSSLATASAAHRAALQSIPNAPVAAAYYKQVQSASWDQVLHDARLVLALRREPLSEMRPARPLRVVSRLYPKSLATTPTASNSPVPVVAQQSPWPTWWTLLLGTSGKTATQPQTDEPPLATTTATTKNAASGAVVLAVARGVSETTHPSSNAARERLLSLFRDSKEPGFREWAAYQLAQLPQAAEDAEILRLLRDGAEKDSDRLVQLACSRGLAQLQKRRP